MQKKITVKEDGRFLIYYHFPATATEEETRVFETIQEETGSGEQKLQEGAASSASALADGGASHV